MIFHANTDKLARGERMCTEKLTDESISGIFENAADFVRRELHCGEHILYTYAIDGLTSGGDISDFVIKPLSGLHEDTMEHLYQKALQGQVYNVVAVPCDDVDTAAIHLVNGFCVVLFPGIGAVSFEAKTGEKRGVSAPQVENTVKGPKDAFVETVRSNTSLVRRHLRTPDLEIYETKVGKRSLTNVAVVSIRGLTNPDYVQRMVERLNDISIDGLITASAVEEYVTGSRTTAFPLLQYTERTDRFCHGLLAGRVGLLVDGLPLGYLAPVDLMYLMESPEDLNRDYIGASAVRVLRYLALLASLFVPGIYIALAVFHQAAIPLPMLLSMIENKQAVPFSTTAEVLGLLIAFELLQESGIHLPQAIGQSVSVVGGIVVGSAAVEAGIISPLPLIAVSIAGICGFVLPNRDLANAVRIWRFGIAVLSAIGGIYGTLGGCAILIIHLLGLKSLGVGYLVPTGKIMRKRLVKQKYRVQVLYPQDKRNQK